MLKSLGLLNETGEPTQRYYDFLDQTQSKKIIAIGIQEAYEDLFNLKKDAQNMSQEDVKNKLKTLTQGLKGERVIESMARTFKTLCDYAEWSDISIIRQTDKVVKSCDNISSEIEGVSEQKLLLDNVEKKQSKQSDQFGLHYNIQIHLPETTNMAVYDAIFQSIKKHLM